jgi:hypothetical protein
VAVMYIYSLTLVKNSSDDEGFSLKNSWLILSWRAVATSFNKLYLTMNGDLFEKELTIAASYNWKVRNLIVLF